MERALIERSRPQILAAKIGEYINFEAYKGCSREIFSSPVALEPDYRSLYDSAKIGFPNHLQSPVFDDLTYIDKLTRLKVWISPEQPFCWKTAELFIKQLQHLEHRICFEIWGNEKRVTFNLLCIKTDLPTINAAFQGTHQQCEITEAGDTDVPVLTENLSCNIRFKEYYPSQAYFHLFTNPNELTISPLETLIISLSQIPEPIFGLYQVLFSTVNPLHNWHENVELLYDIEFAQKLNTGFQSMPQRFAQQGPAGDLKQMAWEVSSKAHNDKPFLAAAIRCAIVGAEDTGQELLQSISSFMNLFQHGGRPMNFLTNKNYELTLSVEQMFEMFLSGLVYRHGFILNSMELSGLVHFPSLSFIKLRNIPVAKLETTPGKTNTNQTGTLIGTFKYTGKTHEVRIPEQSRRSTHLIGTSGSGKSTVQEHLFMDDILNGHGVAIIDPHGDLSERILGLIPEEYVNKVIYLDLGDDEWVPLWNPLSINQGVDIGKAAEDFLLAIQSFISTTGWGDRLEYILRQVIFSVLHLPNATILDVINILRRKPGHLEKFQKEILSIVDSKNTKEFWLNDFANFPKEAFSPPINKLDKLLATKSVAYMLSNPENKINFRKIMDEGNILIVNLSRLSRKMQGILGCFILSILQLNTLKRIDIPIEERKRFDIHIDEVHRFVISNALESFIEEARKFNVTVSFAHQRNSQFDYKKIDAFGGVGTSIIFKVNSQDAKHFVKNLQGKVKASEIANLEKYEAIVRIDSEIHKISTLRPLEIPSVNFKETIIQQSHSRYYKPLQEVKRILSGRQGIHSHTIQTRALNQYNHLKYIKELPFDEF